MRSKRAVLAQARPRHFPAHHRFLIQEQLAHIDSLDETIAQLKRLETIPGIKRRLAEVILAEIGADMSRFPSARHLASWAGMCPGNNESAGKRLSGRTRKGRPWLRTALVEAAHAATHSKDCYLAAQ
jgi:transposase